MNVKYILESYKPLPIGDYSVKIIRTRLINRPIYTTFTPEITLILYLEQV